MITEGNVIITTIIGKNSVASEAEAIVGGIRYSASGTSKCDPHDSFDLATGVKLATGRAIRQLGREIYKDGNDEVRRNDKIRAGQKAEQERVAKVKQEKARKARKEYLASLKKKSLAKTGNKG